MSKFHGKNEAESIAILNDMHAAAGLAYNRMVATRKDSMDAGCPVATAEYMKANEEHKSAFGYVHRRFR